jgi:hypothetical protein
MSRKKLSQQIEELQVKLKELKSNQNNLSVLIPSQIEQKKYPVRKSSSSQMTSTRKRSRNVSFDSNLRQELISQARQVVARRKRYRHQGGEQDAKLASSKPQIVVNNQITCKFYSKYGSCQRGNNCLFVHDKLVGSTSADHSVIVREKELLPVDQGTSSLCKVDRGTSALFLNKSIPAEDEYIPFSVDIVEFLSTPGEDARAEPTQAQLPRLNETETPQIIPLCYQYVPKFLRPLEKN